MAEASYWFVRRRGIAVTIAASGNYVAGTIWPPIIERSVGAYGWQATHLAIGIGGALLMAVLLFALRSGMKGTHRHDETMTARPSVDLGISANPHHRLTASFDRSPAA